MSSENPILERLDRWNIDPSDLLWAIEHGARRPNDRRSKQLRGCARVGGSYLKPYDDEWVIHQARSTSGTQLAEFLDEAERVARRLASGREALPTEPVAEDNVPDGLILPGHYTDGSA